MFFSLVLAGGGVPVEKLGAMAFTRSAQNSWNLDHKNCKTISQAADQKKTISTLESGALCLSVRHDVAQILFWMWAQPLPSIPWK